MPEIKTGDYVERALSWISPIYHESRFIRELFKGAGYKFDLLHAYFKTLREQSFIETVEWGILYQEWKYSLEPRPDLSLEERRARLGLHARRHLPLNPARLEADLLNFFNQKTYLYERDPGHIWCYSDRFTDTGYYSSMEYLLREKPAHLILGAIWSRTEYVGEGVAPEGIFNPDIPFPLPANIADKRRFPRISAGVAQRTLGDVSISIPPPGDNFIPLKVAVATSVFGSKTLAPDAPRSNKVIAHAGVCFEIRGQIAILCEDLPDIDYSLTENPYADLAIADIALARGLPLLNQFDYDWLKIWFSFNDDWRYRRILHISNPRPDLTEYEIQQFGQYIIDNKLILNSHGTTPATAVMSALNYHHIVRTII